MYSVSHGAEVFYRQQYTRSGGHANACIHGVDSLVQSRRRVCRSISSYLGDALAAKKFHESLLLSEPHTK